MDDREIAKILRENNKLLRENHQMLKRLQRFQRWAIIRRFLYIALLVAIAVGGYYYVQPYLERVSETYNQVLSGFETAQNANEKVKGFNFFGGNNNE